MQDLSNENIVHIQKGNIEYLQFKRLLGYEEISHCITLKDLDFGNVNNYELMQEEVIKSYKLVCDDLELDYRNVVRPKQTHTDVIKRVDKKMNSNMPDIFPDYLENVDGVMTKEKSIVLSTTYADCIPLIFLDPINKVVANVHSGWKGTLKRIGQKAVRRLAEEYNCNPENLICCIGPAIQKCHFEVDKDVRDMFNKEFMINEFFIDTVQINRAMLQEAGLKEENIIDSGICTVCNNNLLHSYRGGNRSERRFTSLICIKT